VVQTKISLDDFTAFVYGCCDSFQKLSDSSRRLFGRIARELRNNELDSLLQPSYEQSRTISDFLSGLGSDDCPDFVSDEDLDFLVLHFHELPSVDETIARSIFIMINCESAMKIGFLV
jgi:hypothetical protein